jgi:hypothetical protein
MIQANYSQEISANELRNITLNVAAHQRGAKILRHDRFVLRPDATREQLTAKANGKPLFSKADFDTREAAIMMNQSDGKILDEMEELERETGLDMSEHEQDWYNYVIGGGERPETMEAQEDDESDIPF